MRDEADFFCVPVEEKQADRSEVNVVFWNILLVWLLYLSFCVLFTLSS